MAQTFTFIEGKERDGSHANYLFNQQGEPRQVTVEELRAYYEDPQKVNRLPEVFGSFDNYLAYMTEREELLQSGALTTGDWASADDQMINDIIPEGEEADRNLVEGAQEARIQGYEDWLNGEANQALLQKYGVSGTVYSDSGDKFQWNGSGYVKTDDVSNSISGGDLLKAGIGIAAGAFLGPAAANALSASLGATAGSAAGSMLGSAVSQAITTGNVDPATLARAAITGGIEELASGFEAGTTLGDMGESFRNGVSQVADALGTDPETVLNLIGDVAVGAVTGQDVEQIALNALSTYSTDQLSSFVSDQFGTDPMANILNAGGTELVDQLITTGGVDPQGLALAMAGQGAVEGFDYLMENYFDGMYDTEYVILDPDGNPVHTFEDYETAVAWYESDGRMDGFELGEISKEVPEWLMPILEGGGDMAESAARALDNAGITNFGTRPRNTGFDTDSSNQFYYRGTDGSLWQMNLETGEWEPSDSTRDISNDSGYYDDRGLPIDTNEDDPIIRPDTTGDTDDDDTTSEEEEVEEIIVDPFESTIDQQDKMDDNVFGTDPVDTPEEPVVDDGGGDTSGGDDGGDNSGGDDSNGGDIDGDGDNGDDTGDDGDGSGDDGDGDGDQGEGDGEGDGDGNGNGSGNGLMSPITGQSPFQPFNSGISYQQVGLLDPIQYNPTDAAAGLNNMLGRLKQKRGLFNV